jgi:hypothetical protein
MSVKCKDIHVFTEECRTCGKRYINSICPAHDSAPNESPSSPRTSGSLPASTGQTRPFDLPADCNHKPGGVHCYDIKCGAIDGFFRKCPLLRIYD